MPWQWSIQTNNPSAKQIAVPQKRQLPVRPAPASQTAVSGKAWALVQEDQLIGSGLKVLGVDMASGQISEQHLVTGFEDDFGGSVRDFQFDYDRQKFYYLDANFTANLGVRPTQGRDILLYTIDAATGSLTKATVEGAKDYPTGFSMSESGGMILMATEAFGGGGGNSTVTGFNFFSLDPEAAKATAVGSVQRGSGESDPGYYAGYHRASDATGSKAFRLGYERVIEQAGPGLGSVSISSGSASASFDTTVQALADHDFYMSMDRYGSAGEFLSLAPSTQSKTRDLDLVRWTAATATAVADDANNGGSANATVVAKLGNAHPPRSIGGGDLGYMATFSHGDTFVALVEAQDATGGPFDKKDRWALAVVDVPSGQGGTMPLTPKDVAGEWSVSGIGISK
jgi:hypothetical protein